MCVHIRVVYALTCVCARACVWLVWYVGIPVLLDTLYVLLPNAFIPKIDSTTVNENNIILMLLAISYTCTCMRWVWTGPMGWLWLFLWWCSAGTEVKQDEGETGHVAHVVSPGEFYLLMNSNGSTLERWLQRHCIIIDYSNILYNVFGWLTHLLQSFYSISKSHLK